MSERERASLDDLLARADGFSATSRWPADLIRDLAAGIRSQSDHVRELDAALEAQRIFTYGCGCPAPYDQCTHDEPLLSTMRRQERKIDRLERELAEARGELIRVGIFPDIDDAERSILHAEPFPWPDPRHPEAIPIYVRRSDMRAHGGQEET